MKNEENLFATPCKFIAGAAAINQIPVDFDIPECAFVGKSNVGKSSLINAVTGMNCARVSKQPGRTQQINFFSLADKIILADLPGYGYAAVSKQMRDEWDQLILHYLKNRKNLKRVYLLIDARRGIKDNDNQVMEILDSFVLSYQIVLTKADKIENLTKADDIDLGSMGFGKKALFVIIPAADSTYNFLVSMMYSQLFETLYFVAETDTKRCPGKRLPSHVRFLLDEFANIGEIPEFTKKLATMRKYEISCTIVLQNLAQIKTMYKDEWESIMGNCDTLIFLGGQEGTTLETISKKLGFRTARTVNVSHTFSKQGSSSRNAGEEKVPLMDEAKLQTMPTDECIVIIRGLDPFHDKKYDYPKHPKYALTGDADKNLIYENKRDNTRPSTEAEKKEVIEEADEKADMVYVAGICNAINSKSPLIQVISEPLDKKEIIKELSDMPTSRFIKIDNHTTAVINAIQVEDGFASLDGIQEKERIYTEAEIVSRDEDDGPAEPAESEDDTDFSDFDSKPIFVDE